MRHRPAAVAFDVIETLFSLEPLKPKFKEAGLAAESLQVWYARTLRDGLALDLTGQFRSFRDVAHSALQGLLAEHGLQTAEGQIDTILNGLSELPAHSDVQPSLELLRSAGISAIALTNGSAQNTRKLFQRAGFEHLVARITSIDQVQRWKPARPVYLQAVLDAGVEPDQLALVAAHAWDIQGAHGAGLTTAWFPRTEKRFSEVMEKPDVKSGTLLEAVQGLLDLPMAG